MSARIDTPRSAAEVVREWEVMAIDAHAASWAFSIHHHSGGGSELYRLGCEVTEPGRFKPGPTLSAETIENDPDGEWTAASAVYHEAASYPNEAAQVEFLREVLRLTASV
jgi:hypothetical protein